MRALAVALLVAGGVVLPATAAHAAACDGASGVTVVVDARGAGGSLQVRCAPGDPADGLAALQAAGFSYGFVPNRPGFVCQIDARPDPCNGAPSQAYWAYYHTVAGGGWTYSDEGAGTYDPAPGTVEGWAFGDSAEPGTPPPAAAPTTTTSTTVPVTAPAATTRPPAATSRPAPTLAPALTPTPAAPAATVSPAVPTTVSAPTTAPPASTTTRPAPPTTRSTPATDGDEIGAAEVAIDDSGGGSRGSGLLAFGAGAAGIGGLAAAGIVLARRRRLDDGP